MSPQPHTAPATSRPPVVGPPARRSDHPFILRLTGLLALLSIVMVTSIGLGAADLSLMDVLNALLGHGDEGARTIVLRLRLPRAVLAALIGGGLALSGAVFQALLRNPLAEPYILGVSSGAAVGAVAAVALGWTLHATWALPIAALAGAVLATALVFRIATVATNSLDTRTLLLAGVVIGAFLNAIILLILTFARIETFRSTIFWMMGSLGTANWASTAVLAGYLVPATIILLALGRHLNLLAVGDETAGYLGTRVELVRWTAFLIASVLVAASVAVSGAIGFVGLIIPHAIRLLWGSDHRLLLPASFLGGATFLLLADLAARTLAAPAEIPVGVITALIGVPVFITLLTRRRV